MNASIKRKIIILPGNLNSPFIINELIIIKKEFDEVCYIPYAKDQEACVEIAKKYGVKCSFGDKESYWQILKKIWRWFHSEHTKEEIARIRGFSFSALKRLVYLLCYGFYAALTYENVEREIENFNGEIYLYAYWLSRPAYVISLFAKTRDKKIRKIVSRAHGYDLYKERNSCNYLPFRRFIDNSLDNVFFVSENGRDYYLKKRGKDKKGRYKVSYLGTYNEYGLKKVIVKKGFIVIASCSSIISVKRLDLIIDFMNYLDKYYEIKWIHYGMGELEKKIKKKAEKELSDGSFLFKGFFDNKDLLNDYLLEDIDYFINLSDSEGIPVSIMEAMSIGIPVIARSVGGIGEIVQESNGYLIDGSWTDYTEQIRSFIGMRIENEAMYKVYSENAKKRWKSCFSAKENYKNFVNIMMEE